MHDVSIDVHTVHLNLVNAKKKKKNIVTSILYDMI